MRSAASLSLSINSKHTNTTSVEKCLDRFAELQLSTKGDDEHIVPLATNCILQTKQQTQKLEKLANKISFEVEDTRINIKSYPECLEVQQSNCYPNTMKIGPFEFLRGLAAATVLTITNGPEKNRSHVSIITVMIDSGISALCRG